MDRAVRNSAGRRIRGALDDRRPATVQSRARTDRGLSLCGARRHRPPDLRRRADDPVAEPRLLLGQRLRRIFVRRPRQLSADGWPIRCSGGASGSRSSILSRWSRSLYVRRARPRAARASEHPLQRRRAHLLFMPQTVSLVVVGLVWQVLLVDKIGLFNQFGAIIGISGRSPGSAILASRSAPSSRSASGS